MHPILDPRQGDMEDDASSTKRRSLVSLAGSLLAEISLPKLLAAWTILIVIPVLVLGVAPLLASIWISTISTKAATVFTGLWPPTVIAISICLAWFGGAKLWRLAEANFWSLNALAVQPGYALAREGVRHLAEAFLPVGVSSRSRDALRAISAAAAGVLVCAVSAWLVVLAWPGARWTGSLFDLSSPARFALEVLCNSVVLVAGYVAVAALIWGLADTIMAQPHDLEGYTARPPNGVCWRVAHLSDLHIVGERYGFRIESGRAGPRGNDRLTMVLAELDALHRRKPLDIVLITGDVTDAGRSAEWAEFFDALANYPELSGLVVALPGNHDLNVVDRANPARLDLPTSPAKRLRQMRTLSALASLQGSRLHLVDAAEGKPGQTLAQALEPHRQAISQFVDRGSLAMAWALADVWAMAFPMILPPQADDGLGVVVLNSNAETHFSFTNALGLVSQEQARALRRVTAQFPRAFWIVALHHHMVEYPKAAKALSERIGTALVNGTWFVRWLQALAGRAIVMHGHRHIDWMGMCGGLPVVSAPSPVMDVTDDQDTYFYVHNLGPDARGRLALYEPDRVHLPGRDAGATERSKP
ncbi:Calcineurin-like phosphoesterase [Rhizobiales bacterium GAS113]|nr:Calcineurin-like phosphoesterase [Rhizobiales bacterium GAS113]